MSSQVDSGVITRSWANWSQTDPRWASWNLGIFICIRCSGIHRSMGTHISRVKSVDLDSWTDEQLQSVLSWGNARANKYWEDGLGKGHIPQEAKIENFIRTKYDMKRWAMDGGKGPRPDPASLDVEGDDDIPLSIVKEKQNIERKESIRKQSVGQSPAPPRAPPPQVDLIGGELPQRASTTTPSAVREPPRAAPTKASADLLGFESALGSAPSIPRPNSTTGTPAAGGSQTRPDLKQSILSLYASAPRPPPPQQQQSNASFGGFGGMQSPTSPKFGHQSQSSAGGGFNDAFANLSFGNTTSPPPKSPPQDAFAGLGNFSSTKSTPQPASAFSSLGGGSFFDAKPAKPAAPQPQKPATTSFDSFGDWGAPAPSSSKPAQPASSALGDIFDFSTPAAASPPAAAPAQPAPAPMDSSVFNLSQPKPAPPAPAPAATLNTNAFSNSDVWGGNAWGDSSATAAPAHKSPEISKPSAFGDSSFSSPWGNAGGSLADKPIIPGQPGKFTVKEDDDFGNWTSSTPTTTSTNTTAKQGGVGNDDLFSNVWQ